jgi:GNAT superfamily N-acetyltransferase
MPTNSTILNQTCLSRYQGGFALDGIVAAILESSLIEIKTRELVSHIIEQGYNLVVGIPSVEDYCRLRISTGLSPKSPEAAAAGLPNTLFGVLVLKEKRVIAMGRVVGDDGLFYQVVDIAVEPEHQRRGLGKAIMGKIVDHLKRSAPSGAHVSLIADGTAHHLYAQFGFKPIAPDSIGMALATEVSASKAGGYQTVFRCG